MSKKKEIAIKVLSALLILSFLASGAIKILMLEFEVNAFRRGGLPVWLMIEVGIFEFVAAFLLFRRKTATFGAIIGAGEMLVAMPFWMAAERPHYAVLPLVFLVALVWIGLQHRSDFATWIESVEPSASKATKA